jgi:hypothetical protein
VFGIQKAREPVAWAFFEIPLTDEVRPVSQTFLSKLRLQFKPADRALSYDETETEIERARQIMVNTNFKNLALYRPTRCRQTNDSCCNPGG